MATWRRPAPSMTVRFTMPESSVPGPSSMKWSTPSASRARSDWRHRTGWQSWSLEARPAIPSSSRWAAGVHVGDHRDGGRAEAGRLREGRIQPGLRGGHEWGVEGPTDRQGHHPFGAEVLGPGPGFGDTVEGAGDDHLTGGVVVGDPRPGDAVAGRRHTVGVEAEHRGHGPRPDLGGVLHGFAALGLEECALVVRDGAGGDQGGVLTEAVAGHRG